MKKEEIYQILMWLDNLMQENPRIASDANDAYCLIDRLMREPMTNAIVNEIRGTAKFIYKLSYTA